MITGDVIDCVDIYKQPAFDHPLLKDHKIQVIVYSFVIERRCRSLNWSKFLDTYGIIKHATQMGGSPSSARFKAEKSGNDAGSAGLLPFEGCPMGTIPIRRTTKEDLIREKSLWSLDTLLADAFASRSLVSLPYRSLVTFLIIFSKWHVL